MIYKKNSFERYKEGKALADKYDPMYIKGTIAMLLWGLGSMFVLTALNINLLWSIALLLIPTIPTFKASLKSTHGHMMMKSADETWGSDEEEY